MKLVIGTYNVRGLCARTAKTKLRNVISGIKPSLHILAVQEHKLRESNIQFLSANIWPQAVIYNLPASDGVHAQRNPNVTGRKGGVLIAVGLSFAPLVSAHGTLPRDGGLWLHFETPEGRKMGFLALYAPHTSAERALLWASLVTELDSSRNWLVAGDFNMITTAADQMGGTPKLLSGDELAHWNTFVETYDLQDTFTPTDGIKFTWDNKRLDLLQQLQPLNSQADSARVLKCLDRIYSDASLLRTSYSSEIWSGSELSDHLPYVAVLQIGPIIRHKKSSYGMNVDALQDHTLQQNLTQLWKQWQRKHEVAGTPALLTLKSCIKRAAKYCQLWGKKMAAKRKEKHTRLSLKVQGLSLQLQADPTNIFTQLKLDEARTELNAWESEKARWIQRHLDRRWEDDGERSSKLFFNSIKARKKPTLIHAIQDPDGILHSDSDKVLEIAAQYFENILQEPPSADQNQTAAEELLHHVRAQVSPADRENLQKLFTSEELHVAAKLLGKHKCPGPDGIPLEFYLVFWETVEPLILAATTQGRHLHTTVLLCNEAVFEAKRQGQDSVLLKIDFRKAFDTLKWDFLYSAMRRMNCGEDLITMVTTLNTNAASCVFTDALNHLVNENRLKGIDLPAIGVYYCQGFFADDSHLLLAADRQNLLNAKMLISMFRLASGLEVQWNKSKATWISLSASRPTWTLELHWIWGNPDESDRFLGFYFNDGLDEDTIYRVAMQKVKNKTNCPSLKSTTIHGRIVIANHIIGGLLWGAWPVLSPIMLHICKLWQVTVKLLGPLEQLPLLAWKKLSLWGPKAPGIRNNTRVSSGFAINDSNNDPTWCIRLNEDTPGCDHAISTSNAMAAFTVQHKSLLPANLQDIPAVTVWKRAPVATFWTSAKNPLSRKLLSWDDNETILAALQWRDQSDFLSAPNGKIRKLACSNPTAVPTNTWRFPQAARTEEETWCVCCTANAAEDIGHLFWSCRAVVNIWHWAVEVLHTAFPITRRWSPRFRHAILGAPIPEYCKPASTWWEAWRMTIIWIVWSQRNDKIFRDILPSTTKAKALAWHRLLQHSRTEWSRHYHKAEAQDLTLVRRAHLDRAMAKKLGIRTLRFMIDGQQLFSTWRPPWFPLTLP
ncbi:hypothetical protein R1sor_011754 [Riccia sorocarpa]|uniref:Endonuclease/exonuclease/phosphatase domain-containing protein n=1 Tax=Riccia sorocarpa TaxID=122646 RepID=A0ABD3I1S7_9MARC